MAKTLLQARANPFLTRKVQWIIKNDDFNMAQIVREGVRLFIEKYEKAKGVKIPCEEKTAG